MSNLNAAFLAPAPAMYPRPAAPRPASSRGFDDFGPRAVANLRNALALVERSPRAEPDVKYVRPLLARTGKFIISTPMLAAFIGNVIVREQHKHYVHEIVQWNLAMFDVHTVTGGIATLGADMIGMKVFDTIVAAVGDNKIDFKLAMGAVHTALETVYGKQLLVTGWLPGHRVAEGRVVLELSGHACPRCTVNPTGYKVGDKKNIARCLNSEDCGWTSA